jgi:putative transcriptional regulator
MKLTNEMTDAAVLMEVGQRIARYRLNKNMTQSALGIEAGVSTATVVRAERGHSIHSENLIRILRVLRLVENLDFAIPEPPVSPLLLLEMQKKARKRASGKRKLYETVKPWSWGDGEA